MHLLLSIKRERVHIQKLVSLETPTVRPGRAKSRTDPFIYSRRAERLDSKLLAQLRGTYEAPSGFRFQVILKEDGFLYLAIPGQPDEKLIPYKSVTFRIQRYSNMTFEFVMNNGQVTALKQRDPSGEYVFIRR